MVKNYVDVNNLNIDIVPVENSPSSSYTIFSNSDVLEGNDILFIWSDLVCTNLDSLVETCEKSDSSIIFTDKPKYRYGITPDNRIEKHPKCDGNIPGIYFIKNFSHERFSIIDMNEDFIEILRNSDCGINSISLESINVSLTEYKSKEDYLTIIKHKTYDDDSHLLTRFFNEITIHGNKLIKRCIHPDFMTLIHREIKWYDFLSVMNSQVIPKIYSHDDKSIIMEYLSEYRPLRYVLDLFEKSNQYSEISKLYQNIFSSVVQLNSMSSINLKFQQFYLDLKREMMDKVIERCDKISDMLLNYSRENLRSLLTIVFDKIITHFESNESDVKYVFSHGDLNGSNILVHPVTLDVKFVDSRGYFGKTELYGWQPYEFAKLLYCLYGYDDFNSLPQIYGIDIPMKRSSLDFSNIKSFLGNDNYNFYILIVGIIYISLAGYISQDIMKANIAYDFGIKLLEETLNDIQ